MVSKEDKVSILYISVSFFFSALLLKASGFSVSSIVNLSNHIIKSIIFSASTDTFGALRLLLSPFLFVLLGLAFLALSIALLAVRGTDVGKFSGIVAGIISVALFPSVAGAFLAVAVFLSFMLAPKFSLLAGEAKKWKKFRLGSITAGKALMVFNLLIAAGVFSSVLISQPQYELSFKNEMKESVRALALSLPGASSMSPEVLEQRINSTADTLTGSSFFAAYIVWLPISAALTAWIVLEFLRNIILANLCGLFAYLMQRWKAEAE
ncbi:MAG: hypothetical protein HY517_00785 [Candidatus Aenigmarchaeota archaeon]|nr:hypothetical protein [Candidatus Aenigmarchaeota archaeon]